MLLWPDLVFLDEIIQFVNTIGNHTAGILHWYRYVHTSSAVPSASVLLKCWQHISDSHAVPNTYENLCVYNGPLLRHVTD